MMTKAYTDHHSHAYYWDKYRFFEQTFTSFYAEIMETASCSLDNDIISVCDIAWAALYEFARAVVVIYNMKK